MIDQQGLFCGDSARVNEYTDVTGCRYDVLLYNRQLIATLYDKSWANALAEVVEGFVPRGASLETALRCVNDALPHRLRLCRVREGPRRWRAQGRCGVHGRGLARGLDEPVRGVQVAVG